MHSSRMRTGRSLTVCCSLLPGGGGSPCQVLGGSAWSRGGPAWSGGCLPGPGGGGFSLPGPGGVSGQPPPVNRITHTCKNITFATTSLRPVKTHVYKPCYLQTSSTLNTMQHWRVSIQISLLVKSGFLLL